MSEDQGKPTQKWYKNWRLYLFLLIILLIIAALWVMSIGGTYSPTPENVYDNTKEELQNAVKDYQNQNNGALPALNGDVISINGSVCKIIDICLLLSSQGGILQTVPDGMWSSNGSTDDNCYESCESCKTSHYTWAIDANGSVRSICISENCESYSQDGYQGVWP